MKESDELTNAQSLQIITEMIGKAKRNIAKKGSFYFLLWGVVVMIGNFGHYIIEVYDLYPAPYAIWLIIIPAIIMSIVYSVKQNREAKTTSQIDRVYSNLWIGIFVVLMTVLFFMSKLSFNHNAVILLLASLGTFVSGRLINFTPLVLGGVALWISAIIAFNVSVQDQYLVAGFAIIVGYLIPGFLLRQAERA